MTDITNNLQRAGVKVSQSAIRRLARLQEQEDRGPTRRCKPFISKKKGRQDWNFAKKKKYRDEVHNFWDKILWSDKTKITKLMERLICGVRKDLLMIPNTQALLSNKVVITWFGLAWLLLG